MDYKDDVKIDMTNKLDDIHIEVMRDIIDLLNGKTLSSLNDRIINKNYSNIPDDSISWIKDND